MYYLVLLNILIALFNQAYAVVTGSPLILRFTTTATSPTTPPPPSPHARHLPFFFAAVPRTSS